MAEAPESRIRSIHQHVMRDLQPTFWALHGRLALAAFIGGLLSLVVCGQFGLGLTHAAEAFNHGVHARVGPIGCALICGSLFSVLPVFVLRLASRPMLFRTIVRRNLLHLVAWLAVVGTGLALLGDHGGTISEILMWVLGATAAFRLLAGAVEMAASLVTSVKVAEPS